MRATAALAGGLHVDTFAAWLTQRANVTDAQAGPVLLTSLPRQQWVDFTLDDDRYRFRLMKSVEGKVLIVREELRSLKRR